MGRRDRPGNLTLKGHTGSVSVAFSPDGKRLASASEDQTVKVWDAGTGQETLTLKGHTDDGLERGVQPRRQAARLRQRGSDGEGVGRRDRAGNPHPQGAHRRRSRAWRSAPTASGSLRQRRPDGEGVGRRDRAGNPHPQGAHQRGFPSVAFSPDGKRIASASDDRTVKVWDAGTGQEILTLKGHTNDVTSVAFSPDGKRLASAAATGR